MPQSKSLSTPARRKNIPSKEHQKSPRRRDRQVESVPYPGPETSKSMESLPSELLQSILVIFTTVFRDLLRTDIHPTVQEIKGHLYNRDFDKAFSKPEYLEAYAARWSPSRALGYVQVFRDIGKYLEECLHLAANTSIEKNESQLERNVINIGGGAGAEMVGLMGWLNLVQEKQRLVWEAKSEPTADDSDTSRNVEDDVALSGPLTLGEDGFMDGLMTKLQAMSSTTTAIDPHSKNAAIDTNSNTCSNEQEESSNTNANGVSMLSSVQLPIHLHVLDIAPWSTVLAQLHNATNTNLTHTPQTNLSFHHKDVLNMSSDFFSAYLPTTNLITIMFTLNELFSTSLSKTQNLLLNLTLHAGLGTLLLVIDSPGSYSTVKLGEMEKRYPMNWLLNHVLLETAKQACDDSPQWEKIIERESVWFRVPEELKYPIALENMRYQLHLFRKL
jgi:25S rRNA (uracil2843-N3)-methyltransferase